MGKTILDGYVHFWHHFWRITPPFMANSENILELGRTGSNDGPVMMASNQFRSLRYFEAFFGYRLLQTSLQNPDISRHHIVFEIRAT